MTITAASLFCPVCAAYAHPFLEACPRCGAARASRYAEAGATPDLGLQALPDDPEVGTGARQVLLRYSTSRSGAVSVSGLEEGLAIVATAIQYRVRAVGGAVGGTVGGTLLSAEHGRVELRRGRLAIRELGAPDELLHVELSRLLGAASTVRGGDRETAAAGGWAGATFEEERLASPPPPQGAGDLVILHGGPAGIAWLTLDNPRGFLAHRARPDHYAILVRWLGILAASAAEARWLEVGASAHAAELGLSAASNGEGGPMTQPEIRPGVEPPPSTIGPEGTSAGSSVRAALATLEGLRADGLVSDDEYAAKRREILARL